jgi:inner membrane protein
LALATIYLAWSAIAQQHVTQVVERSLPENVRGTDYRLLVTPAPFNTILWRLVVVTEGHYYEGWHSLLDGPQAGHAWRQYERGAALIAAHGDVPGAARVAAFSKGFFSMDQSNGRLFVTDLRMGQEPFYSFRFDLGIRDEPADITRLERARPPVTNALPWLWARMLGDATADSMRISVETPGPRVR